MSRKTSKSIAKMVRQEKAKAVLLAGGTQEQAAKAAGVTRDQVTRWGKDPAFVEDVQKSAQQVLDEVLRILRSGAGAAAKTLIGLAEEGDRQAAADVLDRIGAIKGSKVELDAKVRSLATLSDDELAERLEAAARKVRGE